MNSEYTAVVKQADGWWLGWIEEVSGVNCQESSHDELIRSLSITLKEALNFNKHEAITAAGLIYAMRKDAASILRSECR